MKSVLFCCLAVAVAAFASPAVATPTSAPLNICNRSPAQISVAVGYYSPGVGEQKDILTGPFVSRGWFGIAAGTCRTLENPFNARYMFWYAFGHGLNDHQDDMPFLTAKFIKYHFCINNYFGTEGAPTPDFVFEDENASYEACGTNDFKGDPKNWWVTTRMVDTWVNATVNFDGCPAEYKPCNDQWSGPR
jgi:hypothetical protein